MANKNGVDQNFAYKKNNPDFLEVFNIEELQELQDLFSNIHGVASIITNPDGEPITNPSNFSGFCSIIRESQLGRKNCFKSDASIGKQNLSGPIIQPCLSCGLWDAGVSINVGKKHVANWLIGQVRNKNVDEKFLMEYAREIGVSEKEYREAYYQVPEMSVEKFTAIANLLFVFVNQLSEKAFSSLELKKQILEKEKITDQKRKTEERFKHVFAGHKTPMILIDLKKKELLDYNQSFVKLFNLNEYPVEEIKQFAEKMFREELGKENRIEILESTKKITDLNYHFTGPKGLNLYLIINASLIEHENLVSISFINDTQNVLYLKELKQNNERMDALLKILQNNFATIKDLLDFTLERAIKITDSKIGYIYYYSEESQQFTLNTWSGAVMDECTAVDQQTLYNLQSTGCWGEAVRQRKPFIINDYNLPNEYIKGTPEGHVKLNKFLTVPIFVRGEIKAVIGVANKTNDYNERDIKQLTILTDAVWKEVEKQRYQNELIAAKEKAEESDRLKSAFLSNMSHEIRTPMNGILGFIELLDDPDISQEDQKHFFGIVRKSSKRLLNTISDIIEIAKIEAGQTELYEAAENLGEILQFHYNFYKPEAESRGLDFALTNQDNKINFNVDRTKLDSIISNLIKNALKFTPKGKIEFGYEVEKAQLKFYVKDTGIGISRDKQLTIFNRFEQADTGINRGYEGSGLGLSIAKAYTEMLGGNIWVESEKSNGSTFFFTIKYQPIQTIFNTEMEEPINTAKQKMVLVAEDDSTSFNLLEVFLTGMNFKLLHATDGEETIKLFEQNPNIDLILMDLKMPLMDGIEATREIRKTNKTIPILAQTAYALSGDKEKALEAGCNDYISKPLNKKVLVEKVNRLLSKS